MEADANICGATCIFDALANFRDTLYEGRLSVGPIQCFRKQNHVMRTWSSKAFQWEKKRGVEWGLNADPTQSFCGFHVVIFIKML